MPKECYCGNKELSQYSENYYVCSKCHTLVSKADFGAGLYNVKDEEHDLYGKNYWQKMMEKMTGQTSLEGVIDYYLKGRVAHWIKYILKYIPLSGKVAEIGCGLGQLAYVMKTMGYDQTAYELSPGICKYIEKTLGIHVHCGEFRSSVETYDAVLAFDVFEHLTKPKEFLMSVYDRLSETGVLCLQMPAYDSGLTYREMLEQKPRFAAHLTEFQHVFLYSREAAENLLKKTGFQEIFFEPACFGDDYDMFLFAGKKRLYPLTDSEVEHVMNHVNAGRIVKALCQLYEDDMALQLKLKNIEADSFRRLANIEKLEIQLAECEKDRTERNVQLKELGKLLEESEKDRSDRMEIIEDSKRHILELEEILMEKGLLLAENTKQILKRDKQIADLSEQLKQKENCNVSMERMLDLYLKEIEKKNQKKWFWK